jgi:hypothetical protein
VEDANAEVDAQKAFLMQKAILIVTSGSGDRRLRFGSTGWVKFHGRLSQSRVPDSLLLCSSVYRTEDETRSSGVAEDVSGQIR